MESLPLGVGDRVPEILGRTDEGTPISLADFCGRRLAVFLQGGRATSVFFALCDHVARRAEDFFALDCSPVLVSVEPREFLSARRQMCDYPFLMISDERRRIHEALCGGPDPTEPGVWLVDEMSTVVALWMGDDPAELIGRALEALLRLG